MASSRKPRQSTARSRPAGRSAAPTRGGSSQQRGRSGPGGRSAQWTTPGASPLRTRIETASRPLLLRLSALPRWLLFLAFVALAVGAAIAPSWWGVACAGVLALFLTWLLFLAWPKLTPGSRLLRILVIGVLVGVGVIRAVNG